MEITQEHRSEIEKVKSGIKCHKDFECYASSFENIGKIGGIHKKGFLECLEKNASECEFSLSLDHTSFCLCPLRIYIANEFQK